MRMTKEKIKIFIADDHPLMRDGVRNILLKNPAYSVVGEAEDGEKALIGIKEQRPDIVFIDISMPGMDGLEATKRITEEFPETKIIILSMHSEQYHVMDALKAGAMGYVLKGSSSSEILESVEKVLNGNRYASPTIANNLINELVKQTTGEATKDPFNTLTYREKEIFKLLALGSKNEEIAEKLSISAHTVKTHRSNIMKKLNAHNLGELVRIAIHKGLISSEL